MIRIDASIDSSLHGSDTVSRPEVGELRKLLHAGHGTPTPEPTAVPYGTTELRVLALGALLILGSVAVYVWRTRRD